MSTQIGKTRIYRDVDEATSALLTTCPNCQVKAVPRGAVDVSPQATVAGGIKHCPNCGHVYGRNLTRAVEKRITGIVVTGTAGATTVTVNDATLQMVATLTPAVVTNNLMTWTVASGTGTASISETGLLTPLTNGTVVVSAKSNDGSAITATRTITLSNQA
jgi:hypothetical protein